MSENFYQILDNLIDGAAVLDSDGNVIFINQPLAYLTNSSSRRILASNPNIKNIIKIYPTEYLPVSFKNISGREKYTEITIIKDSRQINVLSIMFISPTNKDHIILLTRETSLEKALHDKYREQLEEKKKIIYSLKETKEILEQHTEHIDSIVEEKTSNILNAQQQLIRQGQTVALGEMASGMAHEINNPLTIIQGNTKKLERLCQSNNEDAVKYEKALQKINNMIFRISETLKNLKTFSGDSSSIPMQKESIQELVKKTISLCHYQMNFADVDLKINLPEKKLEIRCNPIQISQALFYLISNSKDAVQNLDEKWIKIDARRDDDLIKIDITDSGKGIPPEIREKILWPFFSTKEIGEGTGLGLSSALGIINQHLGSIEIDDSCPNTKFTMLLPAADSKT